MLESDISKREKVKIICCGLMPVTDTKKVIQKHKAELKKDLME